MKRLVLSLAAITAVFGFTAAAEAATATTSLNVSFTAVASCTVSTTSVNFGSGSGTAAASANGGVSVQCSSGTPYHVALDSGLNMGGGFRRVAFGTNYRSYALFTTSALTVEWGDSDYANTYAYGASVADTGSGAAQAHTIYGYLYSGTSLPIGAYSDTVTVTVNY